MQDKILSVEDFCSMLNRSDTETVTEEIISASGGLRKDLLERRTAAALVHEFIKSVLKEPDEPDITETFYLKDIFECKVCLNHIAQIYVKGIMPSLGNVFGSREPVDHKGAEEIISAVFNRDLRVKPKKNTAFARPVILTDFGVEELLKEKESPIFINIDTRPEDDKEYGIHRKPEREIFNIPMSQIMKNPYCIRSVIETYAGFGVQDLLYPIVITGSDEQCAYTTAECLIDAGYHKVYINF